VSLSWSSACTAWTALVAVLILLPSSTALAQSFGADGGQQGAASGNAEHRAAAVVLFRQARDLMAQKKYAQACPKLEEALRLVRGVGIQFNLAECYEKVGKLASAWTHYLEVLDLSQRASDSAREKIVRQRVAALEPRLSRLRVVVSQPAPGQQIKRNGVAVRSPLWGTAVPVDPGIYELEASAPGREGWQTRRKVEGMGQTVEVVIPALRHEVALDVRPEPKLTMPRRYQVASWMLAGVGVASVAVGATLGGLAIADKNNADELCPKPDACYDPGAELVDAARVKANAATVLLGIGASALLGAGGLWLLSPRQRETTDPVSLQLRLDERSAAAAVLIRW